jgi:hypothetical protein
LTLEIESIALGMVPGAKTDGKIASSGVIFAFVLRMTGPRGAASWPGDPVERNDKTTTAAVRRRCRRTIIP